MCIHQGGATGGIDRQQRTFCDFDSSLDTVEVDSIQDLVNLRTELSTETSDHAAQTLTSHFLFLFFV